ncbi:MAG: sodium/proline symporter [Bacteroidia bacterium]|nr:sodium/proline symporter [Bacteroidia bacterium]
MDLQVFLPFILYFLILTGVGIYVSGFSSKGLNQYFLGGRQLHRYVVGLSAVVSGRSAWLLLGFTGMVFSMGISAAWAVVGYIFVEFLMFRYFAPKFRKFAGKNDCITIPDFFAARFDDRSGILRIILAVVFVIFMTSYVSSQFLAGGKALFAYFDISPPLGIVITAVVVLFFTLLGGFMAVTLTDVLQGIVMISALILLPLICIFYLGGWHAVYSDIISTSGHFFNPTALSLGTFAGFLGIGLGSTGNPNILVRYMAIRDPKQFAWIAVFGTIVNILMAGGALLIGLVGRAYFTNIDFLPGQDAEMVYMSLSSELLDPIIVGLLLASVFAAITSTADSQLLIATSGIVRDIYQKFVHKGEKMTGKQLITVSRWVVTALVIIAMILGFCVKDLVFWFVLFGWAGLGASLGPAVLLALFWKRTTKEGVMAGFIAGTVTVIVWKTIPVLSKMIYELIPAFIISFILIIIVSLVSARMKKCC